MNRRELITAGVVSFVAGPAAAQFVSPLAAPQETNVLFGSPRVPTAEEKTQQYAICQERGHTPTVWGNMHQTAFTTTQFIGIPDRASAPYPNLGGTEWQTCWYCKTRYRFVTTMEEEGKP